MFAQVYREVGGVDVVFANAGVSEIGDFLGVEDGEGGPEKPDFRTLEINLLGTLYCEFFPLLWQD